MEILSGFNKSGLIGYGTTTGKAGVISMRNVAFDSGFRPSIYPDDKLIDFVISFDY